MKPALPDPGPPCRPAPRPIPRFRLLAPGLSSALALALALTLALRPAPARAEVPRVVVDIPPVAALVAQVLGDLGRPVVLLGQGADEHSLNLRPSQMASLAEAGLVVWVGPELTPGLGEVIAAQGAAGLRLLAAPGTQARAFQAGGVDMHAWLDPANGQVWLGAIAEALAGLDAENAATYRANARAGQAALRALQVELAASLAAIADRPFLGWHDAYGHFAARFGLTYLGGVAEGDASLPGAARLVALEALAQKGGLACVFPEAGHDAGLLAALPGVKAGPPLDPVGAGLPPGPEAYAALLRGLARALTDCLAP